MDLVALSNGLHGSVQMDSVALFSWIGWLRHHGIFNYTNFWYFDKNGKLDKNILKKVYAIYPQEEASKLNLNANQICLLSLNPIYDYENDESYINFYNEIMSYI